MLPDDEARFAENVQRIRQRLGWSQGELARRMVAEGWESYSQMTVSRTEKLDRPIRLGEARALSRLLGSSLEEMTANPDSDEAILEGLERAIVQLAAAKESARASFREWTRACGYAAASLHRYGAGVVKDPDIKGRAAQAAERINEYMAAPPVSGVALPEPHSNLGWGGYVPLDDDPPTL